jgi:type IX secretion system PorP/SprF family membrane protein
MKFPIFIICFFVVISTKFINAQDIHFSQSYISPLFLNPACTGNFKGDYRAVCNYKDQWSSVSNLYKTVFAATDFVVVKKKKNSNYLGMGLSFYNDRAGKSRTGTSQVNMSIAYNLKFNKYNFFSAGLQFGYAQRGTNLSDLKWDNQYSATGYNGSLATGETNLNNQVNYTDFATGLLWNFIPDEKNKITVGVSMFHVNKPNQSFSKADNDQLNPKIVLHGNAQFKVNEKNISIIPLFLYTNQGKLREFNIGGLMKYGLGLDSKYTGTNKSSSISFGSLYRMNDAFAVLLNMDYKNVLTFGISYDINVSGLRTVSKTRGGFELSIVYSGFFKSEK